MKSNYTKGVILTCLVMLMLTGCKAQAALTIDVQKDASGTMSLRIDLDEAAASAIRRDSFKSETLENIFETDVLKEAGFKVEIAEKEGASTTIALSREFDNEEQLTSLLRILGDNETFIIRIKNEQGFFFEQTTASLKVDLSGIRDQYLQDEKVKSALQASSIDFDDFAQLVISAFDSTTLDIVLKVEGKTVEEQMSSSSQAAELDVTSKNFRKAYVANMVGAAVCLFLGLFLLWRYCRRSQLLSTTNQKTDRAPKDT